MSDVIGSKGIKKLLMTGQDALLQPVNTMHTSHE